MGADERDSFPKDVPHKKLLSSGFRPLGRGKLKIRPGGGGKANGCFSLGMEVT